MESRHQELHDGTLVPYVRHLFWVFHYYQSSTITEKGEIAATIRDVRTLCVTHNHPLMMKS
jgi:hypothetical protein